MRLGTLAFTNWNNTRAGGADSLGEGTLKTFELEETTRGKIIEHTNVALKIDHAAPNHLGFRLESPSGTVSTLLPPYTALSTALSSSACTFVFAFSICSSKRAPASRNARSTPRCGARQVHGLPLWRPTRDFRLSHVDLEDSPGVEIYAHPKKRGNLRRRQHVVRDSFCRFPSKDLS